MMKLKILICFCILLSLSSCSRLPPGNSFYTLTVLTTKKFSLSTALGPFHMDDDYSYEENEIFFIPDKTSVTSGFFVKRKNNNFYIRYLDSTGSLSDFSDFNINYYPQYMLETISGAPGSLFLLNYTSSNVYYNILQYTPGTGSLYFLNPGDNELNSKIFNEYSELNKPATSINVRGAYYSPIDNRIYFLFNDRDNTENHYECSYSLDSTGLYAPVSTRGNVFIIINLSGGNYLHYFYDLDKAVSLLSIPESTAGNHYTWDNSLTPVSIPSLSTSINYLFSNSLIASSTDYNMTIYNYEGTTLNSVRLQDIKFLYEAAAGAGSYRMLFSFCPVINYGYECEYYFYIYTLPTTEITGL